MKMKNKNNKILLAISLCLFVFVAIIFSIVILQNSPYWFGLEKKTFYASVYVNESSGGFDLNATALTFGKIRFGGDSASRSIVLNNNHNFPIIAEISSSGSISQLINHEKEVYSESGENLKIGFTVITKNDTPVGFYDGYVTIKIVPAI